MFPLIYLNLTARPSSGPSPQEEYERALIAGQGRSRACGPLVLVLLVAGLVLALIDIMS